MNTMNTAANMPMDTGITQVNLNLRSGPDKQNPLLQTIPKGSTLTILDIAGDWLHVRAPDTTVGYVMSMYVTIQSVASGQAQPIAPGVAPGVTVTPPPIAAPTPPVAPTPATPLNPPAVAVPAPPPSATAPVTPPAPPPAAAPTPVTSAPVTSAPVPAVKLLVSSSSTLHLRSAPAIVTSPDNVIATLQSTDTLTPLETDAAVAAKIGTTQAQGQWIHVRTADGKEGYVAAWVVVYQQVTPVTPPAQGVPMPPTTAPVGTVSGEIPTDLYSYIAAIPQNDVPIPPGYYDYWAQSQKLGLPAPFDVSPTQLAYPALAHMPVNGFGPNTFAQGNWQAYYSRVDGMHNGLDHIVPLGTPLVAVTDGVIVGTQADWQFLGNANDKSIILWCYLPDTVRDGQGRRMMSNVLVAYGHLSDNTTVKRHDVVKAGQVIGISGRPFGETDNDHLHLEVHLLSGDPKLPHASGRQILSDYKHVQPFANFNPFNPMLFFSERLVRYHLHQGKKIGFGSSPTYPNAAMLAALGLTAWPPLDFFTLASFQYGAPPIWTIKTLPWPEGIYDLPTELQRITNFTPFVPYPIDFLQG